jgi:hypothetical protein
MLQTQQHQSSRFPCRLPSASLKQGERSPSFAVPKVLISRFFLGRIGRFCGGKKRFFPELRELHQVSF